MTDRKRGRYDSAGNWWAAYREPSRWQKLKSDVITYTLLVALFVGVGAAIAWTWSHADFSDDHVYYDPSRRGWTR